jgi:hypothetical protein
MRPRVSIDQIQAALEASAGDVSKAARSLGLARNNLYKRMASCGLSPATYREAPGRQPLPAPAPAPQAARREAPRRSRSFYLRPALLRALDEACLDLTPVLRERLSPSKVLERFLEDRFAEWARTVEAQA